ncbi:MAG TPA: rhodanese-like domain-containing protein [Gemmatimonadaceae bacterium]|nr:rhodanese-like domain-containing protein [Gemmatimonadaceae bacterium]
MANGAVPGDSDREAQQDDPGAPLAELTPRELAELLGRGGAPFLLDVREPHEHAYARIGGSTLIPLATLHGAIDTLPRERDVIVYCHHGIRSAHAVEMLRGAGVRARNLSGGIDRWSTEVDPSVRRY